MIRRRNDIVIYSRQLCQRGKLRIGCQPNLLPNESSSVIETERQSVPPLWLVIFGGGGQSPFTQLRHLSDGIVKCIYTFQRAESLNLTVIIARKDQRNIYYTYNIVIVKILNNFSCEKINNESDLNISLELHFNGSRSNVIFKFFKSKERRFSRFVNEVVLIE